MKYPIPQSALSQHIAVLGKTGSGKTTTAKTIIEHVVEDGARVCILDPIKSDWWGLISSADGKRAGLPFHILGGPRGHVPVHAAAGKPIAELVAAGTLPHSIIDMADFAPGGQAKFFADFAPTLMRKMRGVVYLVLEEAHLFAPKERSGMGDENMMIHWAKMLATAGRTKGIRLIVLTQRTQALHNAVLGSCETVIAHRMTAPADQEQVVKWLKANVKDKGLRAQIEDSLSNLRTGTGWLCSGEAQLFERVEFPLAKTFDNTATPSSDREAVEVRTAAVDVEKLRAIVGDVVAEAQANDPAELKKRVRDLERQLASAGGTTDAYIMEARQAGEHDGYKKGYAHAAYQMKQYALSRFEEVRQVFETRLEQQAEIMSQPSSDARLENPVRSANLNPPRRDVAETSPNRAAGARARQIDGRASSAGAIDKPMPRAMLTALAQHPEGLTKSQILVHTGYRASGPVSKCFADLAREGWTNNGGGRLLITDVGRAALGDFEPLPLGAELRSFLLAGDKVSTMEKAMLRVLFDTHPGSISKGEILKRTGYAASGPVSKAFARLVALGYAVQSGRGELRASEDLFS